ncbi:TVP38/TMEM64 family protein [Proteocatella sphenisci]|uniref:TVP38/TMEM64 family protein n=1 Tax=Proteocatella sphenisci TaxID=181070 RepID=UPI00048ED9FD|nr:VTT domain-containing protein [Proteocatella sphenisci]
MKKQYKLIIFAVIIVMIAACDHHFEWSSYLGNANNLAFLSTLVKENPILALVSYTAFTVVGSVVFALPGVTFAVVAGIMLGPWLGIIACLFATTLGACIAFLASRFFLKDSIKPLLEKNKLLQKLLFSDNEKNSLVILMITRMVPLFPYNIQNFAYGITGIGFWEYTIYTFIFMFPGVSFFTIGAAGLTAGQDSWKYYLTAAVLAVIVTIAGILIKNKYLNPEYEEVS